MSLLLLSLATLPPLFATLIAGDVIQHLYKPSLAQIRVVLHHRTLLLLSSVVLWLGGLGASLIAGSFSPVAVAVTGVVVLVFTLTGFVAAPYILFPRLTYPHTWSSGPETARRLPPDADVIGVRVNGDVRAYPVRDIVRPHIVLDEVGGEHVIISYCLLSRSAVVFSAQRCDHRMSTIVPLQNENNLLLFDPSSKTIIQQLTGRILAGPGAGEALRTYPAQIVPWRTWSGLYPQTKVLVHAPASSVGAMLTQAFLRIHEQNTRQERPWFPTIDALDERLPSKAPVLGLELGGRQRAYPLALLEQTPVVNDELGGQPLLVVYFDETGYANIFSRRHGQRTLTFERVVGSRTLTDLQTGSTWDPSGRAVAGPCAGAQLTPLPHLNHALWFSWANFHPCTELATPLEGAAQA